MHPPRSMRPRRQSLARRRPAPALAVAFVALLAALGTGGAYAASKIGPDDIKPSAVRSKHVKNGAIAIRDINRKTRAALRGRRGPKGDPGASGPPGPPGDTGAPGASGFSADCNEGLAAGDVMVRVGAACIDRYEASIWTARTGGTQITGAIPCDANGQDCRGKIFARSVAGVAPRASISWFQAQQALANSGKRLPTNAEWQAAVAGTPDSTACNVSIGPVQNTGASAGCVSAWGANDMVGNLSEWVADWDEQAAGCASWPAAGFGGDVSCIGRGSGEPSTRLPGALVRSGTVGSGSLAGPFAVSANTPPSESFSGLGFRGAR
jgi:hypothetical protein